MGIAEKIGVYGSQVLFDAKTGLDTERVFNLDSQMLFDAMVLAINIFILFIFLSYVLFNPVRKVLTERQAKITSDRESALKDKEDAQKLKEEYISHLKDLDKEAEIMLSEARKKAMKNEEQIISEAKSEAMRIMDRAKKEAELEKSKAADEVKQQIIEVSTLVANKFVEASIDEKTQDKLIDETLGEIGDNTWQN